MGKYLGVIIGSIIVLLGIIGIVSWWTEFLMILKGSIPALLILGGAIALIAGLSEIKDEASPKNEAKK